MTIDNDETVTVKITISRWDYEQACKHEPGMFDFSETIRTRVYRAIKNGEIVEVKNDT